jgi:hypothetical protein
MIHKLYILFFLANPGNGVLAQNCDVTVDTLYFPSKQVAELVKVINCPLKNGGNIQFFNDNGKYILKLTLNEKFGFIDVGSLQIKSGTKSFFLKTATLYNHKQLNAYFLADVLINYIGTLKEEGITSVVFNEKFEAKMATEDVKNIRRTAKCFYELNKK